jgi:hypothetical protein
LKPKPRLQPFDSRNLTGALPDCPVETMGQQAAIKAMKVIDGSFILNDGLKGFYKSNSFFVLRGQGTCRAVFSTCSCGRGAIKRLFTTWIC